MLLLAVASPAYYFIVYVPNRDAVQQQNLATQKLNQTALLQACMADADTNYSSTWAANCKTAGVSNKGPNCTLPMVIVNSANQSLQDDKNLCLKEYPQN